MATGPIVTVTERGHVVFNVAANKRIGKLVVMGKESRRGENRVHLFAPTHPNVKGKLLKEDWVSVVKKANGSGRLRLNGIVFCDYIPYNFAKRGRQRYPVTVEKQRVWFNLPKDRPYSFKTLNEKKER